MEQHNFGGQFPGRFLPSVREPPKKVPEKETPIENKRKVLEKRKISRIQQSGFDIGKQVGGFGRPPQEDFSFQEEVLRQTVGGRGDKIWGTIGEPVTIHNDLNPRQRGDTSTGELFGF